MSDFKECEIEWLKGNKIASFTLQQGKLANKITKLAEEFPDQCQVLNVNQDGSIFGHIPVEWVKIAPKRNVTMTEERRAALAERLKKSRKKKND